MDFGKEDADFELQVSNNLREKDKAGQQAGIIAEVIELKIRALLFDPASENPSEQYNPFKVLEELENKFPVDQKNTVLDSSLSPDFRQQLGEALIWTRQFLSSLEFNTLLLRLTFHVDNQNPLHEAKQVLQFLRQQQRIKGNQAQILERRVNNMMLAPTIKNDLTIHGYVSLVVDGLYSISQLDQARQQFIGEDLKRATDVLRKKITEQLEKFISLGLPIRSIAMEIEMAKERGLLNKEEAISFYERLQKLQDLKLAEMNEMLNLRKEKY